MAKPVKSTPTIKGKDAQTFFEKVEKKKTSSVSADQMKRIHESVKKFKSLT
jgi:hypothetical protein